MGNGIQRAIGSICVALSMLYSGLIALWFVLRTWLGDGLWWLALLNSFVPYLFAPLVVLLPTSLFYLQRRLCLCLVLPLLLFVALYGPLFLPTRPAALAADEPGLTLMSFNLLGASHTAETARVILDHGAPEIVVVQELGHRMAKVLLEQVGDAYPHHALYSGLGYRGMGVLSRYPVTELNVSHLADPGWQIQVVRIETAGGPLVLYNVHPLSSNVLIYLEQGVSVPERVQASFERRRALIRRLVDDLSIRPEPVIVAGDFNSTDQSDVYKLLSEHLIDVHRAVGWGFGHTFPAYAGRYRGWPIPARQMRIDMVFLSQAFRPVRCYVGSTWGESDHLPVLAELAWRK